MRIARRSSSRGFGERDSPHLSVVREPQRERRHASRNDPGDHRDAELLDFDAPAFFSDFAPIPFFTAPSGVRRAAPRSRPNEPRPSPAPTGSCSQERCASAVEPRAFHGHQINGASVSRSPPRRCWRRGRAGRSRCCRRSPPSFSVRRNVGPAAAEDRARRRASRFSRGGHARSPSCRANGTR